MDLIITTINDVGFPIFACLYLGFINQKILTTIDKRLEVIEIRLKILEGKNEIDVEI